MVDKLVLVTGASSDMGKDLLERYLYPSNHKLLLVSNRTIISSTSANVVAHLRADLSTEEGIFDLCKQLFDYHVDCFIPLQGAVLKGDSLEGGDYAVFLKSLHVNSFSSLLILQTILPHMVSKKYGRIVLMNTASANYGGGYNSFSYGLSKHSILYLTKHLAKFYTQHNILTNCVSPGFIMTKMHTATKSEEQLGKRAETVRVGHAGSVNDVIDMIYHLAFNNDFITGENIKIDGGDFI